MSKKSEFINATMYSSVSHDLQDGITRLMHDLVVERGDFTLAELGYLFSSTLGYCREDDSIHLRVYFDPRLACRVITNPNTMKKAIHPVNELTVFQNYMYVGQLTDCIGFTKLVLPKYKIDTDAINRASVVFKDNDKYEEVTVMYIECNLAITLAAIQDIDLNDPNYKFKYSIDVKKKKSAIKISINANDYNQFPIDITVQSTPRSADDGDDYNGYDSDDAIPFLMKLMRESRKSAEYRAKIQDKVHDEKKKVKKEHDKHYSNKWFNKYS